MAIVARLVGALDARIGLAKPLQRAMRKVFPGHWSFLLGEVTLFSFLGLFLSGVYLATFHEPSLAPIVYRGASPAFAGRALPSASWPDQTARSTALLFSLFSLIAVLSAFFPVEAVDVYGPFQPLSSYAPLAPDWFLMWIEGAFRLLPRQLDVFFLGAFWSNPFYGAVLLPLVVLGSCAIYPLVDRWIYRREIQGEHRLEPWHERPFRSAFGAAGIVFLTMLSLGVLDDRMAKALSVEVWQVDVFWGIVTMGVPPLVFAVALGVLRRRRRRSAERRAPSYGEARWSADEASVREPSVRSIVEARTREQRARVGRRKLDAGAVVLVAAVALVSWTVDSLVARRRRAIRRRATSRTARASTRVMAERGLSRPS